MTIGEKFKDEVQARKNEALLRLNHFAIDLAMLSSEDNLEIFIARRIKEISGAEVAIFSEYNPENKSTSVKAIEMEPGLLKKAVDLFGKQIQNIHSVVTDDIYREMTTELVGMRKSLHEMSFGAISQKASASVQALLKVDRYIGLAYVIEGKLYGTSVLAMRKNQPDLPREILENFVSLVSVSLRRKKAELDVKESETKFREIINQINDGIIVIDKNGKIVIWNKGAENILGLKAEDTVNRPMADIQYTLAPPELKDKARIEKLINNIISNKSPEIFNRSVKNKIVSSGSGNLIDLQQILFPINLGGYRLFCSVFRDITENMRAEEDLKAKDALLQTMYEHNSIATFIIKVIGYDKYEFESVNKIFEQFFDVKNEDLAGKKAMEVERIFGVETIKYVFTVFETCVRTREIHESEFEIPLPNGKKDWWLSRVTPLIDSNGSVYKLIGSSLKITDRKKAEKDLKNKIHELAVLNEELEQFAFANQELNQFAYTASHQLQEPIRTISNFTQIVKEDYGNILDENAHAYLNTIKDASIRMGLLVNTLMEFSRLGRNKKLTYVDCNQLINNVITGLDYMITSSDAKIEVSEMPGLYLYENEMSQLFQNLISNAIKFRIKGTQPKIRVSSEKIDGKWKFSISDNGIGIDPVHFDRIFDIFQRLHTSEEEYEGKGIGLTYCKKIVQLHLGEIWVNSRVGQGSTFNFTIPILNTGT